MKYPGFIGPAYQSRSLDVAGDRCVNLFLEAKEVANDRGEAALYSTPGTAVFCALPKSPVRGMINCDGRVFAVAGNKLYEIYTNGTYTDRGLIPSSGPVFLRWNGYQLFIAHGNTAHLLEANQLYVVPGFPTAGASGVAMVDNYFIASEKESRRFHISELNDGRTGWGTDVAVKEGAGDSIVTVFEDHRELWVFGRYTTEVWWNTGNADFPFERINGRFFEVGCAAARSIAKLDNSIVWLGASERGKGVVRRAADSPQRISTHSIEAAIESYGDVTDAVAYSYIEQGHEFYVLTFPTANKTWAYDAATQTWHEREYWDATRGTTHAVRGRVFCTGFGHNLVGDWENGNVYRMSMNLTTENGAALRRKRVAPVLFNEDKRITLADIQVDVQTAPMVNSDMAAILRVSRDGGYTWSNERYASIGQIGGYDKRVTWRRCGQQRRAVCEFTITDAAPVAIIGAYINAESEAA